MNRGFTSGLSSRSGKTGSWKHNFNPASVIEVQQKRRSPLGEGINRHIILLIYVDCIFHSTPIKTPTCFVKSPFLWKIIPLAMVVSHDITIKLTRIPIKPYKTDEIYHFSMANHPYLPCHRPPFCSKPFGSWRTAELTEASLIGLAGQGWGDKPGEGGSYYMSIHWTACVCNCV